MIQMIMTAFKGIMKLFSFGKQVKEEVKVRDTNNAKAQNKALKVENEILRKAAANPNRVEEIKKKISKKEGDTISINFNDIRGT